MVDEKEALFHQLFEPEPEPEPEPDQSCGQALSGRRSTVDDRYNQENGAPSSSVTAAPMAVPPTPRTKTTCDNNDDEEEEEKKPRHCQWLIDRTNGTSKIGIGRPPCSACWVPTLVVWLSAWIEQNSLFEWLGSVGLFSPENLKARRWCIGMGLLLNVVGTAGAMYTVFAVATNDVGKIQKAAFTTGLVQLYNATDFETLMVTYKTFVGAKAVAVKVSNVNDKYDVNASAGDEFVIPFEEFCDISEDLIFEFDQKCDSCHQVSSGIIFSLFVSLVMCFPSLTTDVLRLYPGYDCNCQKVFASFASLISVGFAFLTICTYQFQCFKSFGYGSSCVFANGTIYDNVEHISCPVPPTELSISRVFSMGPGWIALCVAGICKTLDTLLNLAIPTPTICRNRQEQAEYEQLSLATRNS